MVKFSYEDVNVNNKEEFEKGCKILAKKILGNRAEALEEVVISSDLDMSLQKRMIPTEFKEWKKQKYQTYFSTVGKTIRTRPNISSFCIVFLPYGEIVSQFTPFFCHELIHVFWYLFLDKYEKDVYLTKEEIKKVKGLIHYASEYDACMTQRKIESNINIANKEIFDLNEEAHRILKAYKSLYWKDFETFDQGIHIALAEFKSIVVRQMGYRDAVGENDLYDREVSEGLVFGLFDNSIREFSEVIRNFIKKDDLYLVDPALTLYEIEGKQIDFFNVNVRKYFKMPFMRY